MPSQSAGTKIPRVFILQPELLRSVKEKIRNNDASVSPAWQKLTAEAAESLSAGPFSVMDKAVTPPSGDKHDYMSLAPYWWPNPDTSDGLPYIRRDGEVNPERDEFDRTPLAKLTYHAETLALAYYFSDDEVYASHAANLLRTWFIDEETKMNPHLTYGQGVRGICEGRGIGIIETRNLLKVVNAVGLLSGSPSWTDMDQSKMEAWFQQYVEWLLNSETGQDEGRQTNNHGTHYDVQVAVFSLFVGRQDIAEQMIKDSVPKRIAFQIEPDGSQPLELARTKSLSYSTMNLEGMFDLAKIAEQFDIDLWNYKTSDQRGIRTALEYLIPYYTQSQKWPYPQIQPFEWEVAMNLLRRAARAYKNNDFDQIIEQQSHIYPDHVRLNLLFPPYEQTE